METNRDKQQTANDKVAAGVAVYSRPLLSVYDLSVLGFSNTFVWKCPSRLILDFYNEHISGNHLDVGVGTGYFLDKCRFPSSNPTVVLVDLNANSLQVTAQRLARYNPTIHAERVGTPSHGVSAFRLGRTQLLASVSPRYDVEQKHCL
jgi:ubiquinone/menaquinone biosynthesis C-methylase UbiE